MLQTKLNFKPATAHDAQQYHLLIAAQLTTAAAAAPPPPPPPEKRPVGRPKRPLPAPAGLAAGAVRDAEVEERESKRGNYTIWFDSPHISNIISAYRHHGYSARKAVKFLKRSAPDDRYARLTHSTLTSWFDNVDKWKLHPRFQLQFDNAAAAVQYAGHASALSRSSEVEEEIKRLSSHTFVHVWEEGEEKKRESHKFVTKKDNLAV